MFQMSRKNFFLQIFFILGFPHLRLSEYFLNIYDKRIPQAPSANCDILIREQIQTRKISFYRVGGGGGVKLLPFSFDLCQPQYFLRRRNMKGQIYTWLALPTFNWKRSDLQKWFLETNMCDILLMNILPCFHPRYFVRRLMRIRKRRTVAIRRRLVPRQ